MTLERWRRITEWPLIVASLLFLVTYSIQVIVDPKGDVGALLEDLLWVSWGTFLIDYIVSLALAPRRWHWFLTHLFNLATVVLPMLRPLRVLRVVTLLTVLQRTAGRAVRGQIVIYVTSATLLLVYVASLAVLDAERAGGGSISTFGDAIWWAFATITTVGYGDLAPITLQGRIIAVGLMLSGIALLGVVTATFASWIVEQLSEENTSRQAATVAHVDALRTEIAELRATLAAMAPAAVAPTTARGEASTGPTRSPAEPGPPPEA
ncbi:pH-gated potassium channel KcsA [Microbacterium azadirachtae]|uniref:pH-gated potassium channel KcsA n=1 Tax=Microbacterium azadirachtae TaxID=582680 RepID=A0A0F0L799_9MICO|nr:potassium channel family protein [Microbacterium azadirachtae]KJL29062.1 pH-gated potassium channel KcsA [Microbacterium azadirachtae]